MGLNEKLEEVDNNTKFDDGQKKTVKDRYRGRT